MDLQKLIQLVSERSALWDRNHPDYHNRYKIQLLWMEVGNELNEKYEMVKARWRGLRDNFRKELTKVNDGNQSRWCHFENMLFLKDHTNKQNNDNSQSFEQPDNVQSNDTQSNDDMGGFEVIKLEPNLDEESSSKNYFETSFESINVNSESMVVNGIENKSDFDFIPVSCGHNMSNTAQFMTSQNDSISQTGNTIELPTLTDISKNHVDIFSESFPETVTGTVNFNNNIVKEKTDFSTNSQHNHKSVGNSPSQIKPTFASNNLPPLPENIKKPAKKKPKLEGDVEKLLTLEKEKLNTFRKHSELQNDPNYHFLMSILPELQKIPSNRQLHTRIRILELLIEEQQISLSKNLGLS